MSASRTRWSWKKRVIVAAAVVLGLRAAIALVFPWAVERASRSIGLTSEYEHASLSLTRGRLVLQGLELHARGSDGEAVGEPVVELDYLAADVALLPLLAGEVRLQRADVDGLELRVTRDERGVIDWVERLSVEPAPVEDEPREPEPPTLAAPIAIDALRVQRAVLHVIDRAVTPRFEARFVADARVSHLGSTSRAAEVELSAGAAGVLDRLRLEFSAKTAPREARTTGKLEVAGVHLEALRAELSALGLAPDGADWSMRGEFELEAEVRDDLAIAASCSVSSLQLELDGETRARLAHARFEAEAVSPGAVRGVAVRASDGEVHIARRPDGTLAALGVRTLVARMSDPSASAPSVDTHTAKNGGATTAPTPRDGPGAIPTKAFMWSIARSILEELALHVRDETFSPPVAFDARLERAELGDLVPDSEREAELAWRARCPGTLGELDGRAGVLLTEHGVELRGSGSGRAMDLRLLTPYFRDAGLESVLEDGNWRASGRASAAWSDGAVELTGAELDELVVRDGEEELARAAVSIGRCAVGTDEVVLGPIRVGELSARIHRSSAGGVSAFGARTVVAPNSGSVEVPAENTPRRLDMLARLPRIEIGGLHVESARIALRDESVEPPLVVPELVASMHLDPLVLGGTLANGTESVARLHGSVRATPLVSDAVFDGSVRARPGPLDLDARIELSCAGLDARPLAAHLAASGIEPALASGRGAATVELAAKASASGLGIDARVTNAWFGEGDRRDVTVSLAELRGRVEQDGWKGSSATVRVDELYVWRTATGALSAFGLELHGVPASETPGRVPPGRVLADLLELPRLELGATNVSIRGTWHDDALAEPRVQPVTLDIRFDDLALGPQARTTGWELRAGAPGLLATARAHGTLRANPVDMACDLELDARGIDGARLDAWLPVGMRCELANGTIRARLELGLARRGPRTWSAWSALRDVRVVLGPEVDVVEPSIALGSAELDLELALDEDAELASAKIARCVARGVGAEVRLDAAGALHAAGLVLASDPSATDVAPSTAPEPGVAHAPIPRVALGGLDLELDRLRIVDERWGGAPLDLGLVIEGRGEQVLLAPDPSVLPPIELHLRGRAEPLVHECVAVVRAEPWAAAPRLALEVDLRGVRGAGISELLPELATRVDGAGLVDGALRARIHAEARVARSRADDLGFSRPFGGVVTVEEFAIRRAASEEAIAGVDRIHAEIERIDPRSGDVRVKSLEVTRPFASAMRDATGFEFLGVRVLSTPTDGATTSAPETAAVEAPKPSTPRGVLSIDRFDVRGLDVRIVDATSTPPVVLPLTDLELDVRRFTTRAFTEPVPIAFHARVSSGAVSLPVRERSSSLFAGVLGAAGRIVTGREDERRMEDRPLFDTIALSGRVALAPKATGWITFEASSVELGALGGLAASQGITLGDGVLDQSVRVRLQGERGLGIESTSVFRDLRLSEAPDGPISRYLTLPAPLDTVLFLLEDAEGAHRIPISVRVSEAGLEGGELASAIAGAASTVVARAVASSPLRVLGGVGGLLGLGGEEEDAGAAKEVECVAGDSSVPPNAEAAWSELVLEAMPDSSRALVLTTRLGEDDLARAAELANPPRSDVEAICERLRREKAGLLRSGSELAAAARVHWSVDRAEEARALGGELRELDRRLTEIEFALDRLGEHLRHDAEKRRDARTRAAALTLARERLEAVRRWMVEHGMPASRIEVTRPRFDVANERGTLSVRAARRAAK